MPMTQILGREGLDKMWSMVDAVYYGVVFWIRNIIL